MIEDEGIKVDTARFFRLSFPRSINVVTDEERTTVMLNESQVKELVKKLIHDVYQSPTSSTIEASVGGSMHLSAFATVQPNEPSKELKSIVETARPDIFPSNIKRIGERPCENGWESTYVYGKSLITGDYVYRVVNGKMSNLHTIGSLDDEKSDIYMVYVSVPLSESNRCPKARFRHMGIPISLKGDKSKAIFDILEIEGFVAHKPMEDEPKVKGYYKTTEGVERIRRLEVARTVTPQKSLVPSSR